MRRSALAGVLVLLFFNWPRAWLRAPAVRQRQAFARQKVLKSKLLYL
jgi:hypothetical protein